MTNVASWLEIFEVTPYSNWNEDKAVMEVEENQLKLLPEQLAPGSKAYVLCIHLSK